MLLVRGWPSQPPNNGGCDCGKMFMNGDSRYKFFAELSFKKATVFCEHKLTTERTVAT
ncbi:MAG: hypothetical protein J6K12_00195 [Clostridia bacterium]|nr:hypothetical protein [Clostridia bacterium]